MTSNYLIGAMGTHSPLPTRQPARLREGDAYSCYSQAPRMHATRSPIGRQCPMWVSAITKISNTVSVSVSSYDNVTLNHHVRMQERSIDSNINYMYNASIYIRRPMEWVSDGVLHIMVRPCCNWCVTAHIDLRISGYSLGCILAVTIPVKARPTPAT